MATFPNLQIEIPPKVHWKLQKDIMTYNRLGRAKNGELFLLPGLLTAHLLGADVVVEGEEAVEEDHQADQGGRQQPASVEPWRLGW